MRELLETLCCRNGAPGDEDEVRDFIRDYAAPYATSIRTDPLGNLIVFKKGKCATGHSFLIAAHMDEVAVIVTDVTDEGYLKFRFLGGVDRRVALGKRVFLGTDRVPGIIGIKAIHLVEREEREKIPKADTLYIDIGASSKQQAQQLVDLGTYGYFATQPESFGDGMLKAKALDDRVGCAVMLELLKEDLPLDVVFAFTAQEEVGSCGALGVGYSIAPKMALILEATTAADGAEIEAHKQVCAPGSGPVLLHMDYDAIYDRSLFEELRRIAQENQIPWQCKEYISGGNDAGAFQLSKTGVRVAALAAAVRYLHAPSSVGNLSDFNHILNLTRLFLTRAAEILSQEANCHGTV